MIPLLLSSEFSPWQWLGLTLGAMALFYLPVRRLLQPPITGMRWFLIVVAALVSIYFLLGLVGAAISVWPWWMWLGMGVVTGFVFLVPARSVFDRSNVWRRRIAIVAVSLLTIFIVGALIGSLVRDYWPPGWIEGIFNGNGGDPPQLTETPTPTPTETPTPSPPLAVLPCASVTTADVMENALPSIVQVLAGDGSGSGFIVNEDGLVVTNEHVVAGYDRVQVRLGSGGGTYGGAVAGVHSTLDLAYIQIDGSREFTPIAIGDSDEIRVGEPVIAIGFPLGSELGRDATLTTGVVSAKRQEQGYLQTDASLNPGNSGGPLLDANGYVVGINTAGIDETDDGRTVQGISFAIAINEVKRDLGRQITEGQPANATCPPTPVPTATPAPVPTETPTPVPTATPTPTPTPTLTPYAGADADARACGDAHADTGAHLNSCTDCYADADADGLHHAQRRHAVRQLPRARRRLRCRRPPQRPRRRLRRGVTDMKTVPPSTPSAKRVGFGQQWSPPEAVPSCMLRPKT